MNVAGTVEMPHRKTKATRGARESGLDENQERWLCVTFEYIDSLLRDVEEVLVGQPEGSAFPRNVPDIPEKRRQMIRDAIPPIRQRLVQVLDDLAVPRTQKAIPASRTIRTKLTTIDITLEELKRKEWGRPGSSPGIAEEMRSIIEGLREMVSGLELCIDAAMDDDSDDRREGERDGN
ncbi:MAG: hypothetical protein BWY93_00805 [Euryarchaeota archaeon ADurb.BinA087]|nr:MAG: hypothetical protein BWY93_00805 [Euryarchaeota archaeon ADurb.BinA087]